MHKSSKVQKNAESWRGHDVWSMFWLSIQSSLFTRHCSAETHGKTHFFLIWLPVRWFQSGYQRKTYRRKRDIYIPFPVPVRVSLTMVLYPGKSYSIFLVYCSCFLFLLSLFVVSEMTLLCPLRDTRAKCSHLSLRS